MTITFVLIIIVMIATSLLGRKPDPQNQAIEIDVKMMKVSPAFLAGSIIILGILAGLYASFW